MNEAFHDKNCERNEAGQSACHCQVRSAEAEREWVKLETGENPWSELLTQYEMLQDEYTSLEDLLLKVRKTLEIIKDLHSAGHYIEGKHPGCLASDIAGEALLLFGLSKEKA